MGGFGAESRVTGTVEHSESRRRRGRWSWIVVSALAIVTVAATAVQGLSVPDGGTTKAGAAVTPLPTASQPRGGRIPPAGSSTKSTTKSSGSVTNGGVHSDGVEKGGCESWGSDYVGVTYIHHAGLHGAWSANASGGVFAEKTGQVPFYGSLNTETYCPDFPVDSITGTGDSGGYWLGTQRGAVYGFGDAGSAGSRATGDFTGTMMAVVADIGTSGYWLVDSLGQVFAYGGAGYYGGSPSTLPATHEYFGEEVVAMASTPSGHGYWLLTNYGRVFAYGDASYATYNSSTEGSRLGATGYNWFAGVTAAPAGGGFWAVRYGGQTYAYGASYLGNVGAHTGRIMGIAGTTNQGGYVLMDTTGQQYAYGNAVYATNPPHVTPPPPPPPPPPAGNATQQVASAGNPVTNYTEPCAGDPVNCESGDLWETDTDATVPGDGPHLDLTRSYNSQDAATKGTFGYGWSSSYSMSVAVTPTSSTRVTEANGSTVTFYTSMTGTFVAPKGTLASLARNTTGGYTFRVRNTTTYVFNADGRLTAESDLNGVTTSLSYNTAGQLTKVTDQVGRSLTFTYNASGLVSSVKNPAGKTITYTYTATNLIKVTDPAGRITQFTYTTHRMVTETSPTSGVTTTHYNSAHQVTKQTDPTGLVTTWAYTGTNGTSGTTTITGPTGSVTKETFTKGQMVTKVTAYGTSSAATWHYTYTATTDGQASVEDPDGYTTTTTYNATGDVTATTDPLSHKMTTTYNSFNEPVVTINPMGVTTNDTYDTHGNLIKKVVTADTACRSTCTQTTTYTVCSKVTCTEFPFLWHGGQVETTVDPLGRKTVDLYDTNNNPLATLTSVTGTTEITDYHYNVLGQKTCEATPAAYAQSYRCPGGTTRVAGTTSWTYDADGEATSQTNQLTQTTTTGYDVTHGTGDCTATITGAAYCTVTTSPTGEVTVTYSDQDGRQVGKVAAYDTSTVITTKTAYDVKPGSSTGYCTGVATTTNCTVYTGDNGTPSSTYLNAATEAIETEGSGSNFITTATYDATGHVLTSKTGGGTTTDGYNKDGELTSVSFSANSGYTAPTNIAYTYNADGQQTKMTDGTGTTTSQYDGFARLSSTQNGAGKIVGYTYDADNEVTRIGQTGKSTYRTYNAIGQMTSTTDLAGNKTTFGYSLSGSGLPRGGTKMTTTAPNGVTQTTVDNALGQPVTTSATNPGLSWTTTALAGKNDASSTSCPTSTFCAMVQGDQIWTSVHPAGGATKWSAVTLTVKTKLPLSSISCPSTTLCVAVTTTASTVFVSTNPTGGASSWTKTTLGATKPMRVSCPSTTLCVIAAGQSIFTSTNPTGGATAWTKTQIAPGTITAITCSTTALCVAGTKTGKLLTSTNPTGGASAWSIPWNTSVKTVAVSAISCVSTSLCAAVTATGDPTGTLSKLGKAQHVYTSTAPTSSSWTSAILGGPSGGTGVHGVACPSATFCVATEGTGKEWTTTTPTVEHYTSNGNGYEIATWTSYTVANKANVGGVSCPSTTLCVAGEMSPSGVLVMTGSTHGVRTSATYGTTNDLVSTSSLVASGTTTTATYGYDTLGQLTSSTMTGTPGATGSYTYDAGGDPNKVVDPSNGTATPQTFNTNQEVKKATPHSTSATDATFTYDSIGARTSEKETGWSASNSYAYYQTGELKSVSQHTAGTTASYTYNGQGLRMKATETVNSSTHQSQTFTWDTQTSTPEVLSDGSRYFIYGPTGQVIEQETATLKGALYLVHNSLGSTVATVSSTHAVSTVSYNAYGAVVGHTGNNATPIGYAGTYTDPVTGFLHMVHRYYDPTTGQFLSRDPDLATTHQPYEYAGDDPANLTDPTGDSCAGGPTTATALDAFAAAYELQQFADAVEQYQAGQRLEAYAAAVNGASHASQKPINHVSPSQQKLLTAYMNAGSSLGSGSIGISGCLVVVCGGVTFSSGGITTSAGLGAGLNLGITASPASSTPGWAYQSSCSAGPFQAGWVSPEGTGFTVTYGVGEGIGIGASCEAGVQRTWGW